MPDALVHGIVNAIVGFRHKLLYPVGGGFYDFQRIAGSGAIDGDVLDVLIRLVVYRSQASGNVGGTVAGGGDDGGFHCCFRISRKDAKAQSLLRFYVGFLLIQSTQHSFSIF